MARLRNPLEQLEFSRPLILSSCHPWQGFGRRELHLSYSPSGGGPQVGPGSCRCGKSRPDWGSAPRRPTSSAPKESSSTQGSRTRFVSRKRFFEPIARDSGPGSGPSTSRNPAWSIIGMAASFVTAASRRCAGRPRTSRRDQTYWAASARGLDGFPWIELAGARITSRTNLGLERMGTWLESTSNV